MTDIVRFEDFLEEQLRDPGFREEWERTAFARAVANRVIAYRVEHRLSQAALAKRLGVSQGLIGRLELGEHEPKVSTLTRLSRELGLRFTIDIHPVGDVPSPRDDATVARIESDGVELRVAAG